MLPLLLWFLPKDSLAFRIALRTTNPPKHCAIIIRGLSGHFYSEKKNVTFIINPLQKEKENKIIHTFLSLPTAIPNLSAIFVVLV